MLAVVEGVSRPKRAGSISEAVISTRRAVAISMGRQDRIEESKGLILKGIDCELVASFIIADLENLYDLHTIEHHCCVFGRCVQSGACRTNSSL